MNVRESAPAVLAASLLAACAQNPVNYPPRDFNQQVLTETCRQYITRASPPDYPKRAMQGDIGGYVVLRYSLDGSGKATNIRAIEGRPPGVFDAAAVEALKRTEFDPDAKMQDCFSTMDFTAIRGR